MSLLSAFKDVLRADEVDFSPEAFGDAIDPGEHYRFEYKVKLTEQDKARGYAVVKLDPFRISMIYRMTDFSLNTILKKCLCAGNRGYKDFAQDLRDIIGAAQRRLEMLEEDAEI